MDKAMRVRREEAMTEAPGTHLKCVGHAGPAGDLARNADGGRGGALAVNRRSCGGGDIRTREPLRQSPRLRAGALIPERTISYNVIGMETTMNMDTAILIANLFMENLPGVLCLIFFIYVGMRTGIIPSSKDIDEINRNMTESAAKINGRINKINETLGRQTTAVNILMTKEKLGSVVSESPLRLSEKGEKISRSVNAVEIINSRLNELRPEFEALSNNYDIQEKAMELGESIYDDLPEDVKNTVKNEIYQSGMQLFQVYPIFSLILRDAILKEREPGNGGTVKIPATQPSP